MSVFLYTTEGESRRALLPELERRRVYKPPFLLPQIGYSTFMHHGFYYLSIPYQGTAEQETARTELSFTATAECLRQGIHLFAPMIYVNKIGDRLGFTLEQRREIIMPYLLGFLRVSKGALLVTTEGWKTSWGIKQEMLFCRENHIPVFKIAPEQLYEELCPLLEVPLNIQDLESVLGVSC